MATSPRDPARALLQLPKHGTGLGMHRMVEGLDQLDPVWRRGLDAIKVTGSNGKGSVATMVARILEHAGLRVGLYTSPHLLAFAERIVVQGQPIDAAALAQSYAWFEAWHAAYGLAHPADALGAFEAMTLVALHHFARMGVEAVVTEVGIGGRYDATRPIPGRTCGLVSVDLEHAAMLGPTHESIAFDKADLCPAGGQLVTGPLEPELLRRLQGYCRVRDVTLMPAHARARFTVREASLAGTTVDLEVDDLVLPGLVIAAAGRHQVDNAIVAIRLANAWLRRNRPGLSGAARAAAAFGALRELRLPGRLEVVREDPLIVVDVGHTPAATARAAEALAGLLGGTRIILVTGVSYDREPAGIVEPLVPLCEHVICTRAYHRGGDVARIEQAMTRWPGVSCRSAPTIEEAMALALDLAARERRPIVVAGGLFLAIEAATTVRGGDPRELEWF